MFRAIGILWEVIAKRIYSGWWNADDVSIIHGLYVNDKGLRGLHICHVSDIFRQLWHYPLVSSYISYKAWLFDPKRASEAGSASLFRPFNIEESRKLRVSFLTHELIDLKNTFLDDLVWAYYRIRFEKRWKKIVFGLRKQDQFNFLCFMSPEFKEIWDTISGRKYLYGRSLRFLMMSGKIKIDRITPSLRFAGAYLFPASSDLRFGPARREFIAHELERLA